MSKTVKLNFNILNDYIERKCGGKEYYFGCWSPNPITIPEEEILPENIQLSVGKNWFVARNGADQLEGLLFPQKNEEEPDIVVFRGYELSHSIHSYSPHENVVDYWRRDLDRKHNGIFSAVTISNGGTELNIISDIFGFGPIFYRRINNIVFFSTAAALLSMNYDKPSKLSWVKRLIMGFIPGNDTLSADIEKMIPGSVTTFHKDKMVIKRWYNHKDLPQCEKIIDDDALEIMEKKFERAVMLTQRIEHGDHILTLTSGYDSRRILASLMKQKAKFKAYTVQMPEPTGEDIDKVVAEAIARDYNLDHTVLTLPDIDKWCSDEQQKLFSVDGSSAEHTWSVSLFDHFKSKSICLYDGIGGDHLFFTPWGYDCLTIDQTPTKIPSCLKHTNFPSLEILDWDFRKNYMPPTYGVNRAVISSFLWISRNKTSSWAQQQAKPGHLILCPYMELDHLETALGYVQDEYDKKWPQELFLEKFWPKLRKYSSSRDLEEDIYERSIEEKIPDIGNRRRIMQKKADLEILRKSFKNDNASFTYGDFLNSSAKMAASLARFIPQLRDRINWWLIPASQLILWWQSRPFVIEIEESKD